jgi:RNA polymerase sigma factor (sigma-70 family)
MKRDPRQILTEWHILECKRGSTVSFRELYQLWNADFLRWARIRTDDTEGAREVIHDVWIAIARGLPGLDDPACFARWSYRVIVRRSADWVRARATQRRRDAAALAQADTLAPQESGVASEISDELTLLRAAIDRLPPEHRELLQLFYQFERSVAEIAEILGIPTGTVKSRLFSARESLKKQIESKAP